MGPGTGLGQANLYWSENFGDYRVWPSEGAHASFAPRGWKQRALQTHVERQLGYCEVEHVSLGCVALIAMHHVDGNHSTSVCLLADVGQCCLMCICEKMQMAMAFVTCQFTIYKHTDVQRAV